mgnify:CR=1 FL=1
MNDLKWWLVILTGHHESFGLPRIVQADDPDGALTAAWPEAPSSKKVFQAIVYSLADDYSVTQYPIKVPKPEWMPGKRFR